MNSRQNPQELKIVQSWIENAAPWGDAIRTSAIPSRETVTNQAILDAVSSMAPRHVLDVGCGEGWLARSLYPLGMRVVGIDIVPQLIARAVASGGGEFHVVDYASMAKRQWQGGLFDAAVCNFSLLGHESVESLIGALPFYLGQPGILIIQTLHPVASCGDEPYQDGWRSGSWAGFSSEFTNPAPWYFRTLESWSAMLQRNGFEILERREPRAAGAAAPASVIWICRAQGAVE
jgi:2-polyprenyl-3-methyl-5-hydroxy-6-metoxy-1,4-benzoquinol methylase